MYYEKVFQIFQKLKVKYLVGGGLAVNLHGVPRFTHDIDLLIDVSPANSNRLKKAFKLLGYQPRIPIAIEEFLNPGNWKKWKREKGMMALNFYHPRHPYQEIDLLVNVPLTYQKAKPRADILRQGALKVYLVGLEDLIAMKQGTGRSQDQSDIRALKKIKQMREEA